jgi:ribonuclease HII
VAAAVVLPSRVRLPGLDDSKVLPPEARDELALLVRERSLAYGLSVVGPRTIESLNILRASHLAMRRAVQRAARQAAFEFVLIDGHLSIPDLDWPQEALVDADAKSLAVAAASVLAKTARDRIMNALDRWYPQYGFARHKGYATAEHLEALEAHGPCPWHRFSFSPVRQGDLFHAGSLP